MDDRVRRAGGLIVEDFGVVPYEWARTLQENYAADIATGKRPPTLLLLEHPHVYTLGRRAQERNLLWDERLRKAKGVGIQRVDRGGDVTYHGPGQLVGYPLLPLGRVDAQNRIPQADYVGYVRRLERILVAALARFGLPAVCRPGLTGVWIPGEVHSRCRRCGSRDRQRPAKIAAIGVKVDARGVSRHGFALNVDPDMSYWQGIRPCGLDEPVAGLRDLLDAVPSMEEVKRAIVRAFREEFSRTIEPGAD